MGEARLVGDRAAAIPPGPAEAEQEVAAETRLIIFNRWVMLASQAVFFIVAGLIWLLFRDAVPPFEMRIWLSIVAALLAIIAAFDIAFFSRPHGDPERMRLFELANKRQTVLFDLVAVSVIWLLLPFAGTEEYLAVAAFCVGYVPLQMISDPENTFGNRFSIVAVLGSFMIVQLSKGTLAAQVLAGMIVLYGAMLFYAADQFRDVVLQALRSRRDLQLANGRLATALEEVSRERDAKTRFIAAASHDLGQPLMAARMFADHAAEATGDTARARSLGMVVQSVEAGQAMLGHMLHSIRLEADAVVPLVQPFDPGATMAGLIERLRPKADEAGIALVLTGPQLSVRSDPVLFERAIGNLVDNAIVHSGASRIEIALCVADGQLVCAVRDDGVGIPAGECEGLFEDYAQGSGSQAISRTGFGLGLASVRRIAHLLGGEVSCVENPGGGSVFAFTCRAEM